MVDFEARNVIEALRSGVSSKLVGQYFSSARPQLTDQISNAMDTVCESKVSDGLIISGKYGEGKTHLLKNAFHMAQKNKMVVSYISLSKETPFDKLHLVYQKIIANTYLPGRMQPGFEHVFPTMTPNSLLATKLFEHTLTHFETNKLYYLLKSYLNTEDEEEKFMLLADLEGDFISNANLKQIYKRIFSEKVNYSTTFAKTKHCMDYLAFLSHLFLQLGYNGWVILFDETELIGRLGKKARLTSYKNMFEFLGADKTSKMKAVYSMFALASSYTEDVIESKHEVENLANSSFSSDDQSKIQKVLDFISNAPQLNPLTNEEIAAVLQKLKDFHGKAYCWNPNINMAEVLCKTNRHGHLLRTRIRTAVELLDQLYQYGEAGDIKINELGQMNFEPDPPLLDELIELMSADS